MLSTADISDAFRRESRVLPGNLRPFGGLRACHGHVATIFSAGDVAAVKDVLATAGEGRILVVDTGDLGFYAVLGDRMAGIAMDNGWRGVIVNGFVRDSGVLGGLDFGIWALGTCPRRPWTAPEAVLDAELTIGGIGISPGHYVYCDGDGIVVADKILHTPGAAPPEQD